MTSLEGRPMNKWPHSPETNFEIYHPEAHLALCARVCILVQYDNKSRDSHACFFSSIKSLFSKDVMS